MPGVLYRAGFASGDGSWSPDGRALALPGIGEGAARQNLVLSNEAGTWTPRRFHLIQSWF
jgi:hypothetical protein